METQCSFCRCIMDSTAVGAVQVGEDWFCSIECAVDAQPDPWAEEYLGLYGQAPDGEAPF